MAEEGPLLFGQAVEHRFEERGSVAVALDQHGARLAFDAVTLGEAVGLMEDTIERLEG